MKELPAKTDEKANTSTSTADPKIDPNEPMSGPLDSTSPLRDMSDHTDVVSAARASANLPLRSSPPSAETSNRVDDDERAEETPNVPRSRPSKPRRPCATSHDPERSRILLRSKRSHLLRKGEERRLFGDPPEPRSTRSRITAKIAPESYAIVKDLKYEDYLVANVHVEGHPLTQSYDTWFRDDATYSKNDFTDVIDGRRASRRRTSA